MKRLKQTLWFLRALLAARTVQDFLWGSVRDGQRPNKTLDSWVDVLEKRITKLREVDRSYVTWRVEVRKRLLQVAAVSIAMIEWIDEGGV